SWTTPSCTTTRWHPLGTVAGCCPCSSGARSTTLEMEAPSGTVAREGGTRDETHRERGFARAPEPAARITPLRVARRARDHEPESRLPAGRLRCVHGSRRGGAPASLSLAARRG